MLPTSKNVGGISSGNVKKCAVEISPKIRYCLSSPVNVPLYEAVHSEKGKNGTRAIRALGDRVISRGISVLPNPDILREEVRMDFPYNPDVVVIDENIPEDNGFNRFAGHSICGNPVKLLFLQRCEKAFHTCVIKAMSRPAEALSLNNEPCKCQ